MCNFPRGYDARWWNALAAANDLIAQHEDIVLDRTPTDVQSVTPLTPLPAHAAFTNVGTATLHSTYPDAITAPLLQVRGFEKDGARLVAIGNFCESQSCSAKLIVAGLDAARKFTVADTTHSGAELARGITIVVPALRWTFIRIAPTP
jgi:hypothetical protein